MVEVRIIRSAGRVKSVSAREENGVMIVPGAPSDPMQFIDVRRVGVADAAACCCKRKKVGSDKPRADRPPTRKNSRRDTPRQSADFLPVSKSNMVPPNEGRMV